MTTGSGEATPPNGDLAQLQRQLLALAGEVEASIDDAPSADAVRVLDAQLRALNLRVTDVGRRLFAAETAEISSAAHDVAAALPKVEAALADLARLDSFVAGVTGVLTLADKAIALAGKAAA